jgi:hypothetical protein
LKFADRNGGNTFIMTQDQLNQIMRFPLHPGTGTSLDVKGTWKTNVGKTGIQLTIYDTIGEKTFYKNEFYSGQEKFETGSFMDKRINFLVPTYIPQSLYDVRVGIINWMNPSEEYGAVTCSMSVVDINE